MSSEPSITVEHVAELAANIPKGPYQADESGFVTAHGKFIAKTSVEGIFEWQPTAIAKFFAAAPDMAAMIASLSSTLKSRDAEITNICEQFREYTDAAILHGGKVLSCSALVSAAYEAIYDEINILKMHADERLIGAIEGMDSSTDKEETPGDQLNRLGDDAKAWANEFRKTAIKLGYSDMDEGWLISWFASAIEHSSATRLWRHEAAVQEKAGG